jgi:hypothetical protein
LESQTPSAAGAQQREAALEAVALYDEGNGKGKNEDFQTGHGALLVELS